MAKDKGIYIKVEEPLKKHVSDYFRERGLPGGLSEVVRRFLIKRTNYKEA